MSIYTHKVVDGVEIALTQEEIAELEARDAELASYVPPAPPAPTKEQLMAQLNAIAAQIQAMS